MRRKRRRNHGERTDERIATMLEQHVRDKQGSAAIKTVTDGTLRQRLAAAS